MSEFFGSLWWFVLTLGVLVTFHEFGHYWVARRCGVKVLRFSVGFGRALWSRTARDGTEYQIAMIPLGGYVKMLDDRENEVAPAERGSAFNQQPPLKRIAIIAAGPIANLLLCVALLWVAFILGVPGIAPIVGKASGIAAESGLAPGDRILRIGGVDTPNLKAAGPALILAAIDREPVDVQVQGEDGQQRTKRLLLDRLPADFDQTDPLGSVGIQLTPPRARIGEVLEDGAAQGLIRTGDQILSIEGQPIVFFADIPPALQKAGPRGTPVSIQLRREGRKITVEVLPKALGSGANRSWQLGVGSADMPILHFSPVSALNAALEETWNQARTTLGFLGRLVTGQASTKNLSGGIGIAQAANAEARWGAASLLFFMASLSLTLCILNLLPIPVLDGGHLLYYLTELISGRAVSERVLIAGQYAGLALLLGLILLANTNDILRILRIT